ncbi:RagB/SusD family nutrient uptake outer membrane protein [Parabacteroides distasonis]|uniref:RagB/SusD family nutrient uptake outer membrane protein n=1 Tax=Parabacteroides distasonis TaxID=823 RepID=UPI003F747818
MNIHKILTILLSLTLLGGCNDDFMERYPLDSITDQTFWKSESDLELYCNSFYPTYIPGFLSSWALDVQTPWGYKGSPIPYGDVHSDNAVPENYSIVTMINGTYVKTTAAGSGGWKWNNLRALNFFLDNYEKADIDAGKKEMYAGEILFFKAMEYFEKIRIFGEVPWYSKALYTNSEELYAPRTPRGELMDSLLLTINKAVEWLPSKGQEKTDRINKDMALLLKARICLYEGTLRKYHSDLGLPYDKFLKEAVNACSTLIESGKYSIWTTGNPDKDYHDLFIQSDYSNNPEIILWKKYEEGVLGHAFLRYFTWHQAYNQAGFSKSLVNEYLCSDGQPISVSPLYLGDDSIQSEMKNRDPRLSQTVNTPGEYALDPTNSDPFLGRGKGYNNSMPPIKGTGDEYPSPTGYWPIKFWKNDPIEVNLSINGTMPCPIFRYAEVLLIYAEAKAELGQCSQSDLDITINKLRDRVGMPHLKIAQIPTDPILDSNYSKYCGYTPSALIREIRRERRIELAWENFRWDDLVRWKAGKLLLTDEATRGMKFNQYQYPFVTINTDIYLDNKGYLAPYKISLPSGRRFDEPKQYFYPIPVEEIEMNPNLKQNTGW